jgi:hypothetical protein
MAGSNQAYNFTSRFASLGGPGWLVHGRRWWLRWWLSNKSLNPTRFAVSRRVLAHASRHASRAG